MNYREALAWLYATQHHGIKLGLENVRRLLAALGWQGERQRFLHVAGTNGKGSVCAMLDAICRAAGVRTGLYTSPHLVSFRERVRLDGEMISEAGVAKSLSTIRDVVAGWATHPTFFEITTALALSFFEKERADVVVLETGMGGRLDATNVVTPVASVITTIALDHQAWLGSTIREIAAEKAGIIKPGVPVVSAPQPPEAESVLRRVAGEHDAAFTVVDAPLSDCEVRLTGSHQRWNAALAVLALEKCNLVRDPAVIARGLAAVEWPGRFQRVDERIILDGAHNPAAASQLARTWRETFDGERATLVLGILGDKDVRAICEALLPIAETVIATPVRNPRTAPAPELCAIVHSLLAPGIACEVADDLATALERAAMRTARILVCGSLFLVGEALTLFGGQPREGEFSVQ